MLDLCNIKQKQAEPFSTYLQHWRSVHSRYPWQIFEIEKIDIFVNTLVPKL